MWLGLSVLKTLLATSPQLFVTNTMTKLASVCLSLMVELQILIWLKLAVCSELHMSGAISRICSWKHLVAKGHNMLRWHIFWRARCVGYARLAGSQRQDMTAINRPSDVSARWQEVLMRSYQGKVIVLRKCFLQANSLSWLIRRLHLPFLHIIFVR